MKRYHPYRRMSTGLKSSHSYLLSDSQNQHSKHISKQ